MYMSKYWTFMDTPFDECIQLLEGAYIRIEE